MPASTYTGNKVLDLLVRGVAFVPPTHAYVSLHTADPGLTGASEVTLAKWPGYKRMQAAQGGAVDTGFTAGAAKKCSNTKQLLFPTMDGAESVTLTHWSIWDALNGGNCIWSGALTYQKVLNPTDEVVIHPTELGLEIQ